MIPGVRVNRIIKYPCVRKQDPGKIETYKKRSAELITEFSLIKLAATMENIVTS